MKTNPIRWLVIVLVVIPILLCILWQELTAMPPPSWYLLFPGLTDLGWFTGYYDARWSPDGNQIAFAFLGGSVYTMNSDGTERKAITERSQSALEPDWSPDGKKIAFASRQSSNKFKIYTINSDGSNLTQFPNFFDDQLRPKWSPDGTHIAFFGVNDNSSDSAGIYLVNLDGSNLKKLTPQPLWIIQMAWSPNGKMIAFSATKPEVKMDSPGYGPFSFLINSDGTNLIQLDQTGENLGKYPTWSPDGTRIFWGQDHTNELGKNALFSLSSGTIQPLQFFPERCEMPHWSPANNKIVFYCIGGFLGQMTELFTINAQHLK